ncbi:MAG: YceI family protein [Betaproteobacteria bacterium]|nr:YceI family protein [Betaproteobacteria bacterium]
MRKIAISMLLGGSLVLSALPAAYAAAEEFDIDPQHSNVVFLIDHLGYSRMVGRFNDFSGDFTFDEANYGTAKVSFAVKTESVDTRHPKRDDHLRSPDFFNAKEFPAMTFRSTRVEKNGDRTAKLIGEVTLLGVTRPVTLDVRFNKRAEHPLPAYNKVMVAGFSARGKVKRSDFGMKYALPGVGDEIELIIEVEGHRKK